MEGVFTLSLEIRNQIKETLEEALNSLENPAETPQGIRAFHELMEGIGKRIQSLLTYLERDIPDDELYATLRNFASTVDYNLVLHSEMSRQSAPGESLDPKAFYCRDDHDKNMTAAGSKMEMALHDARFIHCVLV